MKSVGLIRCVGTLRAPQVARFRKYFPIEIRQKNVDSTRRIKLDRYTYLANCIMGIEQTYIDSRHDIRK